MKNKLFLAMSLVFGMAILPAKAQVKIGFINADYILSQMPEAKQVEEDLKNTQKQYETLYQGKVKDDSILLSIDNVRALLQELIRKLANKDILNEQVLIAKKNVEKYYVFKTGST
jgi:outer membrane protein